MILDNRIDTPTIEVQMDSNPAAEPAARQTERVPTTRFGTLEVERDLVITFPEGMIGFEKMRRFAVLHSDLQSAFRWLQSLDEPSLAFPVLSPGIFRSGYSPTIPDSDARFLGLDHSTPALVFVVVTIPHGNPREMTANLLGPLVINPLTRRGKQVIVQDEGYTTRHRVMDELLMRLTDTPAPPALAPVRSREKRVA